MAITIANTQTHMSGSLTAYSANWGAIELLFSHRTEGLAQCLELMLSKPDYWCRVSGSRGASYPDQKLLGIIFTQ